MLPPNCRFVIAKRAKFLAEDTQKFFVDGIIRDYPLQKTDHVWDHHRENGTDCQIQEMPLPNTSGSLLQELQTCPQAEVISPVYDPDAIIAGLHLILERKHLEDPIVQQRMLAVSLACDHIIIPPYRYPQLQKYTLLANKCIGTIYATRENWRQALRLSKFESRWSEEQEVRLESACFARMIQWFADAVRGHSPWPGEFEAISRTHWLRVSKLRQKILAQNLISLQNNVVVFDARELPSRDPRAAYAAIRRLKLDGHLRLLTIWQNYSGSKFTFWTNPDHPEWSEFSYHAFISEFNAYTGTSGGGRRTWGGSDWDADILEHISVSETIELLNAHT